MKTPFNKEATSITKGFHKFGVIEETDSNTDNSNNETPSDDDTLLDEPMPESN